MRVITYILLLSITVIFIIACDKEQDFTNDESIPTGAGYAPVSANPLQDVTAVPLRTLSVSLASPTLYPAGSKFKTELTFFSQSPIKQTKLSATVGTALKVAVDSIAYAPAFSGNKSLDTLLYEYTVPAAASNTIIRLDYQIVNVNTLSVTRTVYVKVQ